MSDEPREVSVHRATPYVPMNMGSFGKANYMLFRQHKFPHTYMLNLDQVTAADSDRCRMWDFEHARAADARRKERYGKSVGFHQWIQNASIEQVMAFLKDILKVEKNHPGVKWTGFRICGTVNRATGYPVYHYNLFAKHPETKTKVYSGANAPNVRGFQEMRRRAKAGYQEVNGGRYIMFGDAGDLMFGAEEEF